MIVTEGAVSQARGVQEIKQDSTNILTPEGEGKIDVSCIYFTYFVSKIVSDDGYACVHILAYVCVCMF